MIVAATGNIMMLFIREVCSMLILPEEMSLVILQGMFFAAVDIRRSHE